MLLLGTKVICAGRCSGRTASLTDALAGLPAIVSRALTAKIDKTSFDVMEVSDVSVRVDGNSGIVTGVGWGKGKDNDSKPFDVTLRFTDTYIRSDGRWQAWASQATIIPTAKVAKN